MPIDTNNPPLTVKLKSVSKNLQTTTVVIISNPQFNSPKLLILAPSLIVNKPIAKIKILMSNTADIGDDCPIIKVTMNRIKTGDIGLMSFNDLFFTCKTSTITADNDTIAEAKNSGDVITSLNK